MFVINRIIDNAVDEIETEIDKNWTPVTTELCEKMGLDTRARAWCMWVSRDGIAVKGSTRSLDYYGGFEYVDSDAITKIGDITFYSIDDDRVRGHVLRVLDKAVADGLRIRYDDPDEDE